MGKNALGTLGKKTTLAPLSHEEEDLLFRSSKKVNNAVKPTGVNADRNHWPELGSKISTYQQGGTSFLDKLKGSNNREGNEKESDDMISEDSFSEDDNGAYGEDSCCITVEDPQRNFPTFSFSDKMKKRLYKPWKSAVIIKLLGRQIGYKTLVQRIQALWARKGILSVINIGHGYFVVKLSNREDYINALTGGPWMLFDHYLTVQPWEPGFKAHKAAISKVAVWVRIPKIPMEYYDEEALTYIGNRIGKTLKVDMNTSCQLRGHFARICVLVELGKQLMSGFKLDEEEHFLEYEGLHLMCTKCGIYGHRYDACPLKKADGVIVEEVRDQDGVRNLSSGEQALAKDSDQWKVVQKRRVRRGRDRNGEQTATVKMGSRFNALVAAGKSVEVQESTAPMREAALNNVVAVVNKSETKHGLGKKNRSSSENRLEGDMEKEALEAVRCNEGTDGALRRVLGGRVQKKGCARRQEKRLRKDIGSGALTEGRDNRVGPGNDVKCLTIGEVNMGSPVHTLDHALKDQEVMSDDVIKDHDVPVPLLNGFESVGHVNKGPLDPGGMEITPSSPGSLMEGEGQYGLDIESPVHQGSEQVLGEGESVIPETQMQ